MSLAVAVQKDLSEYEPKLVGKLTGRTAVAIAMGLGAALAAGLYLNFVVRVPIDDFGWLVIAASAPGWLVGFWKPDGMHVEKWLPLWLLHAATDDDVAYARAFPAEAEDRTARKENSLAVKQEKRIVGELVGKGSELLRPTCVL